MLIANTTGSATGTNNVTVRTGAKFGGTGSMDGNLSIYANSYLFLQDSQCAALTVKGELTFAANSNMSIDIEPSTSLADIVNAGGKIAVAGNLEISKKGNSTFQEGMTFKIFNTTKGITGSFTQITTALDNGLAWDQSRLSEGIIKVSKSTALPGISADKVVKTVEYYNLAGVAVNEDAKGFIIRRTIYTDGSVATDKVLN